MAERCCPRFLAVKKQLRKGSLSEESAALTVLAGVAEDERVDDVTDADEACACVAGEEEEEEDGDELENSVRGGGVVV